VSKEQLEQLDARGIAAWDSHDTDAWVDLFADEFTWYDWSLPEPIRDKAAARAVFGSWMTAFPDMQVKQTDRVVGDDAVAGEILFLGTNTGPISMGGTEIPPTNRTVTARGSYIARVRDGKIVEFSAHEDIAGMMIQLGLIPQP
jgi:predicted ester cyclase